MSTRIYYQVDKFANMRKETTAETATTGPAVPTAAAYDYPSGVSGYGTFNQSGNVFEWCEDRHGKAYPGSTHRTNPSGPEKGSLRHDRGCCWRYSDRSAFRYERKTQAVPGALNDFREFRLATSIREHRNGSG